MKLKSELNYEYELIYLTNVTFNIWNISLIHFYFIRFLFY